MDGFGLDDPDGIRYGVSADGSDSVVDYLVAVFRLAVSEQNGVVSEVLLYEAVDIDAIVMPDGSLDGIVADDFQRCHFRRTARSQSKQSNCHNSQDNRHKQRRESRISFIHQQKALICTWRRFRRVLQRMSISRQTL